MESKDIIDPKSIDEKQLQVIIDDKLQKTPETGVFELNLDPPSTWTYCWFWTCRGPTFLWGFIKGIFMFLCCCLACKKSSYSLTDKQIQKLFRYQWPYSKLLDEIPDEQDMYVLDTTIMNTIIPFSDTRVVGVRAYFSKKDCTLVRISIPENKQQEYEEIEIEKPTPQNTRAHKQQWEQAKLFMMQGAHHLIKFALHPWSHFPQQTFIDLTKMVFNEKDIIYQAFAPHWEFSDVINDNVLLHEGSVLNARTTTCCCFDTQTMPRKEIQKILNWGATKYSRKFATIPDVRFKRIFQELADMGEKIGASYLTTATTIAKQQEREQKLDVWKKGLNKHLNYELDAKVPLDAKTIGLIWADFVFKVAIQHSSDHHGFGNVDFRTQPMTIRSRLSDFKTRPVTRWDMFKHLMYSNVFVHWVNNRCCYDTRIIKVKYNFKDLDPSLARYFNKQFEKRISRALSETRHIIPKDRVASSVQW